MRKRKGNILVYVLVAICVAIYIFFFENTEEPFVPHYYTWDGRDIYYQSKPNQPYSDHEHYVLAVTEIPHVASSPREKPSEPFGQEAKDFVKAALISRDIYIERLGNSPYVYVWLDAPGNSSDVKGIESRMLNAQLISRGYSKYLPSKAPFTVSILPAYNEVFLSLQREAQTKHAGIWSLQATKPKQETFSVYHGEKRVLIDPNDDDEQVEQKPGNSSSALYVVITPKGKKYHYTDCRTVKSKYTKLTVAQARKRGYKPCKVCSPPEQ